MDPLLISILAWTGGISLYLVAIGFSGSIIYKFTKSMELAIIGGVFWPITIPFGVAIGICVKYVESVIHSCKIEKGNEEQVEPSVNVDEINKRLERVESTTKLIEKKENDSFKVGDLVTVKGYPDGYKHLYEGCKCRVVGNEGKSLKVILLDHVDYKAQKFFIGKEFKVPPRNLSLIKKVKSTKKSSKRR
jgi:hypothetical protein